MDDLKLYGGPGCGKTRNGIHWLFDRVREGSDVGRVAFVSYTNAAVDEAKGRICETFAVDPEDLPYTRTLHSLCKRALGVSERDWCAENHLKDFGEACGYDVTRTRRRADEEGVDTSGTGTGEDSPMLDVWDFARHRGIENAQDGFREFAFYDPDATARLTFSRFSRFVTDYEEWKQENCLRDYTDLLTELVQHPVALPVSVAVIDEAQDLSPLMWQAADALFADAEMRATLGDDDQAIYSFSGADPSLMNRRPAREVMKLRQSYRMPARIAGAADWIIRQNANREPKELVPMDGADGTVERITWLEQLPLANGESWYLLLRNWKLLPQYTEHLEAMGLPYKVLGNHYSPWDPRGPRRAAETLVDLASGKSVTIEDVWALAQRTPSANSKKTGVWAYGSKKRIEAEAGEDAGRNVSWRDLLTLGMTTEGFERVMRRDLDVLSPKVAQRDLRAYEMALHHGYWRAPARVTLGTVHSVKGREADNVVVLMGCTTAPARAILHPWRREEENRVAYVAVTRARKRVYGLVAPPADGVHPWEILGI